ncbi:MAG: hypothetical protein ACP5FH_12245, partial [Terracidiphilus sp.]
IAPVFDVASHLLLVDVEDGREAHREEKRLVREEWSARADELLNCSPDVLICGAISAPLQLRIAACGVRVNAFLCGAVDDVLAAYLNGTLASRAFAMPGCQRWRRQEGEDIMPGGFGAGAGRGGRRRAGGQGQGSGGAGRMGGAAGAGGFCVCPKCGEKMAHTAGQPCQKMQCPKCGGPLVRA